MSQDFWKSAEQDGSVIIKPVEAIAVYTNEFGDIVIRQRDPMGDSDQLIYFPKEQAFALVNAIQSEADSKA
jgi:hypothetical protein